MRNLKKQKGNYKMNDKHMNTKLKSISGMTLAELMAVVVVIGIATSLAGPSFDRGVQRIKFRGETKNVVSVLRTARSNAVTEKSPYGVYFDGNAFTLTMFKDKDNLSNFSYESGSDSVVRVDSLPDEFTYLYATFPNSAIVFQPNGTASNTGDIYLMSESGSIINLSQLSVLASTGRSKIEYIHNF